MSSRDTSCPDEDCTVCPPRAWCEDLDALDYALLNKKGKLAARQCILHSLIEDYKFPAKLPSWEPGRNEGRADQRVLLHHGLTGCSRSCLANP